MDLEQLKSDLNGLSTMAQSSRERLAELATRVTAMRQRLERLVIEAESPQAPDNKPS